MVAHGWIVRIASHGSAIWSSDWLAALKWKPLDIPGTQPSFRDVVVKVSEMANTTMLRRTLPWEGI